METAQPLSIESFSYSWLVNLRPSLDSLDGSLRASLDASYDEASFIEMDPRMPPSKRFLKNSQDFKFDFPISQTPPLTLVHADELFSNGYIMPFFVNPLKMEAYEVSDSTSTLQTSSQRAPNPDGKTNRRPCLRKSRRRLSKRMILKYLDFLRLVYRRIRGFNSSSKAESVEASAAYSADEWRKSFDSESSIYEAVLHCKQSIGRK